MSRTRIVKGTYTKISQEGHSMYFKTNIITTAGKSITEVGEKNGVSYNEPKDPPVPVLKAKCLVEFRPHGNWKGEFGFDWVRGADSGLVGDKKWVKNILGKHYTTAKCDVVTTNTNSWTNFFKKDSSMYDRLMRSFKNFQINWKLIKKKPYLYQVPVISLIPNKNEAKLSLKIEIQEKPKELIIRPKKDNTGVVINHTSIPIQKGKYNLNNFLTIKCTQPLKEDLMIDVLSDNEICGQLRILANDNKHIKKIDVIIVPVKTQLGAVPKIGKMVSSGESFFRQNLIQALIKPNIRYLIKPLNVATDTFKNRYAKNGVIFSSTGSLDGSNIPLLRYLDTELEKAYPKRYTDFYKLYFLADNYPDHADPRLVTQGFSNFETLHGVFFNYHDRSTVSHETFHAMGLPHTFDGVAASAKFTYKAQETDNIMDYCHWSSDLNGNPRTAVEGKILYYWQWKIVNKTIQ